MNLLEVVLLFVHDPPMTRMKRCYCMLVLTSLKRCHC